MNFASCSSTRLAFGPGSAVTIRGVFASKVVGMSSSMEEIKRLELIENCRAKASARTDGSGSGLREKKSLVSLRRRVVAAGRPAGSSPGEKKGEFEGLGSLAFPADAAVFSVFDHYTTICKFFADAVGRGEIAFFL